MKKVFITGISGFAGSHLHNFLKTNKSLDIFGTTFNDGSSISDKSHIFSVDLNEKTVVDDCIKKIRPDFVFHLAALTAPAKSFVNPHETLVNNINAQLNILEAIRRFQPSAQVLIVGSGDEYGLVNKKDNPIKEYQPLNPTSPYAVSKISQDFLGLQYALGFNLKVIRVRPFNHIGPGQNKNFVVSAFAKQIAEIEANILPPVIKVGNLSAIRDFTDVSDMIKAYWLAINYGKIGDVYNLGSGLGIKVSEILNVLLSHSSKKIKIEHDKSLIRPSDNPVLICDYSKFNKLTGWSPKISIDQTLKGILFYWRAQLKKES